MVTYKTKHVENMICRRCNTHFTLGYYAVYTEFCGGCELKMRALKYDNKNRTMES